VRRAVLQHADSNFSWDHVAQLTTELYCDLLTAKPDRATSSARATLP
jgi:hypothetical protein